MEFDTNVNVLFRDAITKLDSRLQVCRRADLSYADGRSKLFDIVNKMGEASARAQGLAGTITTGRRLETSDHHLYIMKDTEGNRGQGAVVGILKVGHKRLFVYDRHGQQWEMNPLCVLDFYVHESRQRTGCGRRLFDFMVKSESMSPQHLAVDRPSVKFSSFLAKHYGLRAEIPQVNNFVIFQGFFTHRPTDGDFIHNRRNTNGIQPADLPSNGNRDGHGSHNNYNCNSSRGHHPHSGAPLSSRPPSSAHTRTQAAGRPTALPPRQTTTPFPPQNSIKDLNLNPRSAQSMAHSGNNSPRGPSDADQRSVSDGSGSGNAKNRTNHLQLQSTMYSRYQPLPPAPSHPHGPPGTQDTRSAASNTSLRDRPPSGSNKRPPSKREKSPPLLQRDGAPRTYQESFNLHQNYQGRAGHLLVTSEPSEEGRQPSAPISAGPAGLPGNKNVPAANTTPGSKPPPLPLSKASDPGSHSQRGAGVGYYTNPALHPEANTSWTVFGVLRRQNNQLSAHSSRTRLW